MFQLHKPAKLGFRVDAVTRRPTLWAIKGQTANRCIVLPFGWLIYRDETTDTNDLTVIWDTGPDWHASYEAIKVRGTDEWNRE